MLLLCIDLGQKRACTAHLPGLEHRYVFLMHIYTLLQYMRSQGSFAWISLCLPNVCKPEPAYACQLLGLESVFPLPLHLGQCTWSHYPLT